MATQKRTVKATKQTPPTNPIEELERGTGGHATNVIDDPVRPAVAVESSVIGVTIAKIEVIAPVVMRVAGYSQTHVDLHLSAAQAKRLCSLRQALDGQAARLLNNRVVQTSADAAKWLLEQLPPPIEG